VLESVTVLASLAIISAAAPGVVGFGRSGSRARQRGRADAHGPTWRLSRTVGNVFRLTNVGAHSASDVEVKSKEADVEVKPRGAPWPQVGVGDSVEFVTLPLAEQSCTLVIRWITPDGVERAAEANVAATKARR
jgi:hypothetical protein